MHRRQIHETRFNKLLRVIFHNKIKQDILFHLFKTKYIIAKFACNSFQIAILRLLPNNFPGLDPDEMMLYYTI